MLGLFVYQAPATPIFKLCQLSSLGFLQGNRLEKSTVAPSVLQGAPTNFFHKSHPEPLSSAALVRHSRLCSWFPTCCPSLVLLIWQMTSGSAQKSVHELFVKDVPEPQFIRNPTVHQFPNMLYLQNTSQHVWLECVDATSTLPSSTYSDLISLESWVNPPV